MAFFHESPTNEKLGEKINNFQFFNPLYRTYSVYIWNFVCNGQIDINYGNPVDIEAWINYNVKHATEEFE